MVKTNIIVQKFGGSTMLDAADLIGITDFILAELKNSNFPVVVVSALFGKTNNILLTSYELLSSEEISNKNKSFLNTNIENKFHLSSSEFETLKKSELDSALSTCENFVSAFLAMTLCKIGVKAKSLQGWQVPIITDSNFGKAKILEIDSKKILDLISNNIIPIISGFQGVTRQGDITTIGRGGTDISAAAIAKALNAQRIDIYKDVPGIMSCDPKLISNPKLIVNLDYETMYNLSINGTKALNYRSCEIAMRYSIPIRIIGKDSDQFSYIDRKNNMETKEITGISINKDLFAIKISSEQFLKFAKDYEIEPTFILKDLVIFDTSYLKDLKNIDSVEITRQIAGLVIVGFSLDDNKFISKILNLIEESKAKILYMEFTSIKIQVILEDSNPENLVKKIHDNLI